jgi:peptidoglycan/LPS O-acetylase OafA/YrhL
VEIGVVPSFGRRLPGIEGLRALAACSILVLHAWLYSSPSGHPQRVGPLQHVLPDLAFGVTLFFTLSGFLLYRPFVAALLRESDTPSFSRYLWNRALRILPAYWAILLLCALVFQSVLSRRGDELVNGGLFDPGLLGQAALLLQDYTPGSTLTGIGPAWSLAVEAAFYLALPLLVLLAWTVTRRARTRARRSLALLLPALLMLVIGLSGKAAAAYVFSSPNPYAGWDANWHSVLERSFWCQADLFAFGMALAVLHVDAEDGLVRFSPAWRRTAAFGALGSYAITAKMTYLDEQLSYSFYNTLMALACALLLALVVLPPHAPRSSFLLKVLETRPLVWLGLVSYSVFLWHEPLVRWLQAHDLVVSGSSGFLINVVVLATITFALSAATYYCVEKPSLRLKHSRRATSRSPHDAVPRGAAASPTPTGG